MSKNKQSIIDLIQKTQKNIGCAFVSFKSSTLVSDIRKKPEAVIRTFNLTEAEKKEFRFEKWTLNKAPVENNISWPDLNKVGFDSIIKKVVLIIILFVVSVVLITPLTVSYNIVINKYN